MKVALRVFQRRVVLSILAVVWIPAVAEAQADWHRAPEGPPAAASGPLEPWAAGEAGSPIFSDACGRDCTGCGAARCRAGGGFFSGAEFLLIQPHFSEAVAFARGSAGPASLTSRAEPLEFGHDGSLRAFAGYRDANGEGEFRFTYWMLQGETAVTGGDLGPGEFIVDPFGNLFGIDPTAGAAPFYLAGGESIATRASIDLHVFDIDMGTSAWLKNPNWNLGVSAGVRIADVAQEYESVIRDAANVAIAGGDYAVDFTGAGPRLGASLERIFGRQQQFSAYGKGAGSLLLGHYDVTFGTEVGPFRGGQDEQLTRLIPVLDLELGGGWAVSDRLTIASGWMNQAWFDLGTSGGSFSGLFTGADDANLMAFSGVFWRAEYEF